MVVLGFRVTPTKVYWAAVRGTVDAAIKIADDKFSAPKSFSEAQALTWYRDRVQATIAQYHAEAGAMRYADPTSRNKSPVRFRIEGVLLEALNSAGCKIAAAGSFNHISSKLGLGKAKSAKLYLKEEELRGINWSDKCDEAKDAIMIAVAGLGG